MKSFYEVMNSIRNNPYGILGCKNIVALDAFIRAVIKYAGEYGIWWLPISHSGRKFETFVNNRYGRLHDSISNCDTLRLCASDDGDALDLYMDCLNLYMNSCSKDENEVAGGVVAPKPVGSQKDALDWLLWMKPRINMYTGGTIMSLAGWCRGYDYCEEHLIDRERRFRIVEFEKWINLDTRMNVPIRWYNDIAWEAGGDGYRGMEIFYQKLDGFIGRSQNGTGPTNRGPENGPENGTGPIKSER